MPIWAQIVVPVMTAVLTLIATTVTSYLLNGPKRKREEREAEIKSLLDKVDTLNKSINDRITQSEKDSKILRDDIKLLKMGLQSIIKNDLKVQYHEHLEKQYASVDTKEDLEKLYQVYHSLGCNGIMDGVRAQFLKLPEKPPKTK